MIIMEQEQLKELYWNNALAVIADLYNDRLPYPLNSYFYVLGNLIIFDLKKELEDDIKNAVLIAFEVIYE